MKESRWIVPNLVLLLGMIAISTSSKNSSAVLGLATYSRKNSLDGTP